MGATRLPSFQFYPGDYLKDTQLASVSLSAQGLAMRMLCHMSESPRRGYLEDANGNAFDEKRIARLGGCAPQTCKKLLRELEDCGVFSRTQNEGVIFSRRMVRDELIRLTNKENGKKGGNPNLMNSVNHPDNQGANRGQTPSSSDFNLQSSSSDFNLQSSNTDKTPDAAEPKAPASDGGASNKQFEVFDPSNVPIPQELRTKEFLEAWTDWIKHKRQRGMMNQQSTEAQLKLLVPWGAESATESIHRAIAGEWNQLYLGKNHGKAKTAQRGRASGQYVGRSSESDAEQIPVVRVGTT